MKITLSVLALALVAGIAHAEQPASLHQQLTEEQGMSLVSDGLYATRSKDGESFVAVNRAGQLELASRIAALRSEIAPRLAKDGLTHAESKLLANLERSQESLLAAASVKADVRNGGNCNNGNTLYTRAYANGGYTASAYAVNALDFSPPTPTFNEATAYNDFVSNYVTATGLSPAQAAVNNPGSCIAVAEATVTCPGNPIPQSVSIAYSYNRAPRCLL